MPSRFEAQERMAFLHAELDRLPEKYRLVLTLRYLQHLSYDEISTALGVPMGTVKTHIHRARRMLTEHLRQWEEHVPGNQEENRVGSSRSSPMPGRQEVELCTASM
jgi:predicted RNA polymerase sigma factor